MFTPIYVHFDQKFINPQIRNVKIIVRLLINCSKLIYLDYPESITVTSEM